MWFNFPWSYKSLWSSTNLDSHRRNYISHNAHEEVKMITSSKRAVTLATLVTVSFGFRQNIKFDAKNKVRISACAHFHHL